MMDAADGPTEFEACAACYLMPLAEISDDGQTIIIQYQLK
jgi:hypothetical protein